MKKKTGSLEQTRAIKLVLTGGPSGGKTTVAQAIVREFSDRVVMAPEAATILFSGGWPRRRSEAGVKHQQRAIFYIQQEIEALLVEENHTKLIICDRGSLDGMAYWPDQDNRIDYLKSVKTNVEEQVARYDWVMHLDTAPQGGYDTSNPLRNESFDEAQRLNKRIREVWKDHPRRFILSTPKSGHFIDKLQHALFIVESILKGESFSEIQQALIDSESGR